MATKSTNINIRVNPEIKSKADPILQQMGITATQLYNLLLAQVAITRSVPFPIVAEPQYPQSLFDELDFISSNRRPEDYMTMEECFSKWDATIAEVTDAKS